MKRTEDYISLEREELCEAIYANDSAFIAEVMEGFNFVKDGTPPHFTESMHSLAFVTLEIAAIAASKDALTDEIMQLIINYTATVVDIFGFMRPAANGCCWDQGKNDYEQIPKKLKKALRENKFSEKAAKAIDALSQEEFVALINYVVSGEIEELNIGFSLPIIRGFYQHKLLIPCLIFSYMASALRTPIPNALIELGDMFGSLFDGIKSKDENDNEETE